MRRDGKRKDQTDQYNIIRIKNITTEDFEFESNSEPYLWEAGESRNFPKFIARLAVRKLIDHIANMKDPEGKLNINQDWRQKQAAKIVISEEKYKRKPTKKAKEREKADRAKESDLDMILKRNKARGKVSEKQAPTKKTVTRKATSKSTKAKTTKTERFEGIEDEKLPTRAQMMKFAKKDLKMELEDPKTIKAFKKLTDAELYVELGMGN